MTTRIVVYNDDTSDGARAVYVASFKGGEEISRDVVPRGLSVIAYVSDTNSVVVTEEPPPIEPEATVAEPAEESVA